MMDNGRRGSNMDKESTPQQGKEEWWSAIGREKLLYLVLDDEVDGVLTW